MEVLQSDFLTQGPKVPLFEESISNYCGVKYGVAVNSATSALHIGCLALGTCGGIGSSQHLHKDSFYSNGIQGGIVPVAAGMALAEKYKKKNRIVVVFIGDGTLGEGVVYETMNLASLLKLPLHIVCENNMYAQSTKIDNSLAGSILDRPESFGIKTFHSNTWDLEGIFKNAEESTEYARSFGPVFHLVDTYRLNHHSKSDDNRDVNEVKQYAKKDPLNIFMEENPNEYDLMLSNVNEKISGYIKELNNEKELSPKMYVDNTSSPGPLKFSSLNVVNERVVNRINEFFHEFMAKDSNLIFIGEDVLTPYGGAFKVSKDLSTKFPNNVLSTPISEAAITGIANGLALKGFKPYLELMFGDFILLALDQIINHASKFHHMYNKQVSCPIVIRTPMGGGRGYGPTHSQTLDKFIMGIDNLTVIALNSLVDPKLIYKNIYENQKHPTIVIENKLDYGRFVGITEIDYYSIEKSDTLYPVVKCSPLDEEPTLTIVTYGGISHDVINIIQELFIEIDLIPEVIVLSQISPLDISAVLVSVQKSKRIVVVEEGSKEFGIGSEIIAQVLSESKIQIKLAKRIGALSVPIPSSRSLENYVLPNTSLVKDIAMEVLS
ncbi:thiamine pyrophosphate-dependent enzyme [Candidatus Pseudothioglobus singularis]|nr:thiamine pyrophosphate-dependent enzyme [Candidatus Pseudothioglobus singularis]